MQRNPSSPSGHQEQPGDWPGRGWHRGIHGADFAWAIAFALPYVAVFLAFVVYPVAYGLWLGSNPALYRELFSDPIYFRTVVNTALYRRASA